MSFQLCVEPCKRCRQHSSPRNYDIHGHCEYCRTGKPRPESCKDVAEIISVPDECKGCKLKGSTAVMINTDGYCTHCRPFSCLKCEKKTVSVHGHQNLCAVCSTGDKVKDQNIIDECQKKFAEGFLEAIKLKEEGHTCMRYVSNNDKKYAWCGREICSAVTSRKRTLEAIAVIEAKREAKKPKRLEKLFELNETFTKLSEKYPLFLCVGCNLIKESSDRRFYYNYSVCSFVMDDRCDLCVDVCAECHVKYVPSEENKKEHKKACFANAWFKDLIRGATSVEDEE